LVSSGSIVAALSWAEAATPEPDAAAGQAAYRQSCARCHGAEGKGDGPDAVRLYPKPRDLTSGVFKFRSTASGTAPTDEDLFQTITNGLPSAGMPDWKHLDESVRWQLVAYVKGLSSVFHDSPPEPVSLGTDPGRARADAAQGKAVGKAVYEKLGCAACHGPQGRADGPSASSFTDNWGLPVRPANLTQGWNYRGGSDPKAIAQRILTGIDGSPMPSYAEAASAEDVWQLAYYVQSLQREPRWGVIVRVPHVAEGVPTAPDDPRWETVSRHDVWVRNAVDAEGALSAPQTVTAVSFQAVADDDALSIRLSWYDPSEDREDPADALALVLKPAGVRGDAVTLQTWPLRESPALDLCVWSAKSQQAREALSLTYEAMLSPAPTAIPLESQARYDHGEWAVVLTRPLAPADIPEAAVFEPQRLAPVAFAVWDGSNAGQRAVSAWVDLVVEEEGR
jgi:DMSO reductase family type II enzyme heme b subunit